MKPVLDRMTDLLVNLLSGDARTFYDREFGFFKEVTSFSGKRKLFINSQTREGETLEICLRI
jgi:phosphatidylinositol 4-kinase